LKNAGPLSGINVLDQQSFVLRMGGASLRDGFCGRVSEEGFLAGDSNALPQSLGQQLRPLRLKPVAVAGELLENLAASSNFDGVRDYFNDELRLLERLTRGFSKERHEILLLSK
jgi:hypothetical protein